MFVTRRRPLAGVIGALAVSVVVLSGCAAGQDAQTVEQTSVVDGTAFQAGQVALRDFGLQAPGGPSYAAGGSAYLEGLIVNRASDTDQLVSVSTPIATSVQFYANAISAVLGSAPTPSASTSASSSPGDTASPTDGTTPTDGSTPSGTTTSSESASPTSSAPAAEKQVELATNQAVQFGYQSNQPAIVLVGLTKALFPSQSFPITFTFANGGSVTATISVKLPVGGSLEAPTVNTEESEGE